MAHSLPVSARWGGGGTPDNGYDHGHKRSMTQEIAPTPSSQHLLVLQSLTPHRPALEAGYFLQIETRAATLPHDQTPNDFHEAGVIMGLAYCLRLEKHDEV